MRNLPTWVQDKGIHPRQPPALLTSACSDERFKENKLTVTFLLKIKQYLTDLLKDNKIHYLKPVMYQEKLLKKNFH